MVDVDRLIPGDHPARAIWEFIGRLDLSAFYEKVKAVEGRAGQPAFDPRLMISVWVYGLSRGVNSVRALSHWCDWEPGLQWLCAMGTVNYHSLSSFRVAHGEALQELFQQVLGVLSAAHLIGLERVAVDGTRIRASCGNDSFRQPDGLKEHLEEAAAHLEEIGQESEEVLSQRTQAARERRDRERQERIEAAQAEMEKLQQARAEGDREKVQVSVTEPEARIMKQPGAASRRPITCNWRPTQTTS